MKLIRFQLPSAAPKPGVQRADGSRIDVSGFGEDYNEHFFGTDGPRRLAEWLTDHEENCPQISAEARLVAPCARPSKIVCVGMNYAAHAAETGAQPPTEPVIFMKATSAITGPYDPIVLPKDSTKTDWEVELAVVIGKRASYVTEEEAMDHVVGYVLHNDVSERAFQIERGGQWVKGKSADTFAPLGPWIATADEISDPHSLRLWLKVNDEKVQDSTTADFIFNLPQCISYISRFMTLLPGDVISTGTPSGVGLGMKPNRFLKAGDVVELGIDGLGTSRQEVKAYQKN
ncbi:2-keto-4-pentenoate hydratase/2-oxohepta-3-ene-1,7-dioic acid hydratase in catechol pathway [Lewinella aquimaris]|uniref:2-keto-4-pentenoate hydratase/2-oxohepta-3-ene-1,7-dioic acid hydratase in catechol pathway n=1 Tax=Neolewinella aquimaris TaxID=1835722 RepID=A0A840DZH5_9BACT|nr:fumarylacetoacetate hydrolase family protein [Neolewinella aquimaris]MBB4078674.1 2-keto-4-pentenoate hydratase/2-oxohepta-3-ene-1,7-dioic acid hydratase in catechol pathway [Neolewinella aquimaris]